MSLQRFISELCKGPGTLAVVVLNLMVLSRAQALSITSQPQTQTNNEGQSVTFTVSAQGVPPFAYQWLKGDELIPGATNDAYSIASAAVSDAGIYSVNVSD